MSNLHIIKAHLSACVQVPAAVFERHSPFSPETVGEQLAAELHERAHQDKLGYYPALDYFQAQGVLDKQLLEVLDQLTWLATSATGEELRTRLRPLFAGVQVQSMQALAYSMPQVRPGQSNAMAVLTKHLTPNQARFDLLLTLFRKNALTDKLDCYIERVVYRHLREAFDSIHIGNIKILE